jgi:ankyrin repeat protein
LLERLAAAGGDLTATDDDGKTALFYVLDATNGRHWTRRPDGSLAWNGTPVIHWLTDRGVSLAASLLETGTTTLMAACAHDCPALVDRCVRAGVDLDRVDARGKTALFYADGECARLLLEAGADPTIRDSGDATAWDVTRPGGVKDALLQARGFPPRPDRYAHFPDARGRTRLMMACEREDLEAIERFVSTGDVNARDRYGKTALHYLLSSGYFDDNTVTALDTLLAHPEIDASARSKAGTTALHLVARTLLPDRRLVEALLARGADPNLADATGKTPRAIMESRTHDPEVLALLG